MYQIIVIDFLIEKYGLVFCMYLLYMLFVYDFYLGYIIGTQYMTY